MVLEYKTYVTKVEYDNDDKIYFGKIENIKGLVNFECDDLANVENAFHEAVDDYLDFCEEIKMKKPNFVI